MLETLQFSHQCLAGRGGELHDLVMAIVRCVSGTTGISSQFVTLSLPLDATCKCLSTIVADTIKSGVLKCEMLECAPHIANRTRNISAGIGDVMRENVMDKVRGLWISSSFAVWTR